MDCKERVLMRLTENGDGYVSGGVLAQECGVSRNAVWKAVTALRAEGCAIEAVPHRGYRLTATSSRLYSARIQALLTTTRLGRTMHVYDTLASTNQTLRAMAAEGAVSGTTVLADCQFAGRGRRGRSFDSHIGAGLYMSVLLKPDDWSGEASLLTSCAAVAVARAIEDTCAVDVRIKWVNDLFVNEKKVCGILTEAGMDLESGQLDYVVLGIGINTKHRAFPPELRDIATTLQTESGQEISRNRLAAAVLNRLENALLTMDSGAFLEESRQRSLLLGRDIWVHTADGAYPARAVQLDEQGRLVVETDDGERRVTLHSGEVSVRL